MQSLTSGKMSKGEKKKGQKEAMIDNRTFSEIVDHVMPKEVKYMSRTLFNVALSCKSSNSSLFRNHNRTIISNSLIMNLSSDGDGISEVDPAYP